MNPERTVLEHVFQISELVLRVLELNELSSGREVDPRSKVVCNPKLGGHRETVKDGQDGEDGGPEKAGLERSSLYARFLYIPFAISNLVMNDEPWEHDRQGDQDGGTPASPHRLPSGRPTNFILD